MFLKTRPLIFSLIFLVLLEVIVFQETLVFYVSGFLFVVSFFQGKMLGKEWRYSILPVFFTISSVALLYLITLFYEQQFFIALAFGMYYLSLLGAYRLGLYENDQTARGMIMAATVATIFFTYASVYGIYLNFLVPLFVLMVAYLIVTLLVSYQYFALIKKDAKRLVWIYSFLLALIMTELIWTMNFWPFGYLTTGVIALILYYILWDIIQSYFLNLLSRKRIVANAILFSLLISLILITSKWLPVI